MAYIVVETNKAHWDAFIEVRSSKQSIIQSIKPIVIFQSNIQQQCQTIQGQVEDINKEIKILETVTFTAFAQLSNVFHNFEHSHVNFAWKNARFKHLIAQYNEKGLRKFHVKTNSEKKTGDMLIGTLRNNENSWIERLNDRAEAAEKLEQGQIFDSELYGLKQLNYSNVMSKYVKSFRISQFCNLFNLGR